MENIDFLIQNKQVRDQANPEHYVIINVPSQINPGTGNQPRQYAVKVGNLKKLSPSPTAGGSSFNNTASGLTATTVQGAIDEVAGLRTVVNISSAQILDLGNTAVELLPDPGTGKYYDVQKILFEMSAGTTVYFGAAQEDIILNVFGGFYGIVTDSLLGGSFDSVATLKESVDQDLIDGVNSYYPKTQAHPIDAGQSNILLSTYSGDNPTLGNGTLRVILEYKIRTFGA